MEDGRYVVRAEIPGIDPAKDVDITVRDGRMTIKAERTEKKQAKGRSEFVTAHSSARLCCRQAPTKTTSKPHTTKAS